MKCSVVRETLQRGAEGDILEITTQKQMDAHLAQCASCQRWRAYHQALIKGPGDRDIPPFRLSPKVRHAIQETIPPVRSRFRQSLPRSSGTQSGRFWHLPALSFQFRTGLAAVAALIMLAGALLFVYTRLAGRSTVEVVEINGQPYRVIALDASASFNPKDVNIPDTPALQITPPKDGGLIRQQLGFLTDALASALRKSLQSAHWEEVRRALEAQEMEIPANPPKHLVISDKLVEWLDTDARDIELWVIQPNASVLLFRTIE